MKLILFIFLSFINSNYESKIINLAKQKQLEYSVKNTKYVVIIDYSKPISIERLYLVDITINKVILKSIVGHGVNSGKEYVVNFSNEIGSLKSSYGGFITAETYYGKYGYSLVLDGKDKNINDNARNRKIVFHSTKKMKNPSYPLTFGCFATPENVNTKIINLIKNGCLVYVIKN